MGMTIAEKIIARAAGLPEVHAGEIHTVELDYLMSNDGTSHLTVDKYNKLKNPHIEDVKKLVWIVDHNVPCDSPKTAASQKKMRDFAKEHGIAFYEGEGVCHQVMLEKYVSPGMLIFGADSHTCSYGALGAFGTGVGNTDYLYGMVTGKSWVMTPETLRFNLIGKLQNGATARDLILTIIGGLASVIGFATAGSIADKIGRKWTISCGLAITFLALIIMCFVAPTHNVTGANGEFSFPKLLFAVWAIKGFGMALVHNCSFPMVVELSSSKTIGKFTGFYYAASMSAQTVTPILLGLVFNMTRKWRVLSIYAAILTACSFAVFTLLVKNIRASKVANAKGLEAIGAEDE